MHGSVIVIVIVHEIVLEIVASCAAARVSRPQKRLRPDAFEVISEARVEVAPEPSDRRTRQNQGGAGGGRGVAERK